MELLWTWLMTAPIPVALMVFSMGLSPLSPRSFDWSSQNIQGLTTYGVYDFDCSTILQTNDEVQLIWVGPDNVKSSLPPNPTTRAPGGDDKVLDTHFVENVGYFPVEMQYKGYIYYKTYSYNDDYDPATDDTVSPEASELVFIRAWNAPKDSAATYYGDGVLHRLTGDFFNWPRFCTNVSITPTAVDLTSFTATSQGDDVLLAWETESELDVIGFNLHRRAGAGGEWQKLNQQPLPTVGPGGLVGHAYAWIDSAVPRGVLYYYRLDEVLPDGTSKLAVVTSVFHGADFHVWLPVMVR